MERKALFTKRLVNSSVIAWNSSDIRPFDVFLYKLEIMRSKTRDFIHNLMLQDSTEYFDYCSLFFHDILHEVESVVRVKRWLDQIIEKKISKLWSED